MKSAKTLRFYCNKCGFHDYYGPEHLRPGGPLCDYAAIPQPRGRPVLPPEQRQTERVEMRCTKAQREKLERLGGVQWLRDRIDRAREA